MKGITACAAVAAVLLLMSGCSRDLVPDSVLEGLHKPVIGAISPTAVRSIAAGFLLWVDLGTTVDDQYVLYIEGIKIGQVGRGEPGFAGNSVSWLISGETVARLLADAPRGGTFAVRVTSIDGDYDISGDFERYRDYVSEPASLAIGKGETKFTTARQLFPEWTHSYDPIVRCSESGDIFLAWRERINDEYRAFYSYSADAGQSWSQVLDISRGSGSVDGIDIAGGEGGSFYMAWRGTAGETADVYLSRSHDFGHSWYAPKRMNAEGEKVSQPALAVDDQGNIFLAWLRSNGSGTATLRLAVSRDLGYHWEIRDIPLPADYEYWRPLIVARWMGRIDMLQGGFDFSTLHLHAYSSRDYGSSWQESGTTVGESALGIQYPLLRFAPGGQSYVVWGAYSHAGHYFSHWNYLLNRDSDGSWGAIQDLKLACPSRDERTALSVSAASVDAVLTGPGCLFLLRSKDDGRSWPVPEAVPGSEGFRLSGAQDMAAHSLGKTFLVFLKETGEESCLYFTQFE